IVVEAALIDQLRQGLADAPGVKDVIVVDGPDRLEIAGRRVIAFDALGANAPSHEPEVYVEDRDPISCLYTSGTTSAPKGVVSSHLAVYLESLGVALDTRMTGTDHVTALMPLFHTAQ